jgi:glycosyltransferase involved in cell wall biosynthesis
MISVLLPTYNCDSTIVQSVRNILGQSVFGFELLVLDDGSTDNTEEKVTSIDDSRIKYLRLNHQGLTKTLNYGLSVAKYDIIARMDADDLCVPWRLEKQLTVLKNLSKNTILSSWYVVFSNTKLQYCVQPPISSREIKKGLLLHSFISHPGLMCNKETLMTNGGYINNVEVDGFQDYETWLRIKDKVEFYIIPEILMFQRYRKESLSNNIQYKQKMMYAIQEPYYKDLSVSFAITTEIKKNTYRGWREYFYGNKLVSRKYWGKLGFAIITYPRIIIAWFITFLPEKLFLRFKEARVKFRLIYYVTYFSSTNRNLRKQLSELLMEY